VDLPLPACGMQSGQTVESLQFAAGSDPERARGLSQGSADSQETVKSEGGARRNRLRRLS
jgi:hypothetical protein